MYIITKLLKTKLKKQKILKAASKQKMNTETTGKMTDDQKTMEQYL